MTSMLEELEGRVMTSREGRKGGKGDEKLGGMKNTVGGKCDEQYGRR